MENDKNLTPAIWAFNSKGISDTKHKNTSGPAVPISSKVSRSQNLTLLSAEPGQGKNRYKKGKL